MNFITYNFNCLQDIIGETNFGGKFNSIETLSHPLPGKVYQELRRRAMVCNNYLEKLIIIIFLTYIICDFHLEIFVSFI